MNLYNVTDQDLQQNAYDIKELVIYKLVADGFLYQEKSQIISSLWLKKVGSAKLLISYGA